MGDFNARVQEQLDGDETPIGPHLFDPQNTNLNNKEDNVLENRTLFLSFAATNKLLLANTLF